MLARSSPVDGPLLGLLLEQPGYAYDLSGRLERRLGPSWRLPRSSVYHALDRLERSRLVYPEAKAMNRPRAGDRVVYRAAAGAEMAFERWMESGCRSVPVRSELAAKLCVARPRHVVGLRTALNEYERDCLAMLAALGKQGLPRQDSWSRLIACMMDDAVVGQLSADIQWARRCRDRLDDFAGEHRTEV